MTTEELFDKLTNEVARIGSLPPQQRTMEDAWLVISTRELVWAKNSGRGDDMRTLLGLLDLYLSGDRGKAIREWERMVAEAQGKPFRPSAQDIEFAKEMVRTIKHGDGWALPRLELRYQFDRDAKTLTLLNPKRLEDPDAATCHARTILTFAAIGWTVVVTGSAGN